MEVRQVSRLISRAAGFFFSLNLFNLRRPKLRVNVIYAYFLIMSTKVNKEKHSINVSRVDLMFNETVFTQTADSLCPDLIVEGKKS